MWQETEYWGQTYMNTHLNLIRNDRAWAELCANLVCPGRIKVYEAKGPDVSVALYILEIAKSSHITLVGVVLPIKLHGRKWWNERGVRHG
jgi:hypothetical protein